MNWREELITLYWQARALPDSTLDPHASRRWFEGAITRPAAESFLSEMGFTARIDAGILTLFHDTLRLRVVDLAHEAAVIWGREREVELAS